MEPNGVSLFEVIKIRIFNLGANNKRRHQKTRFLDPLPPFYPLSEKK